MADERDVKETLILLEKSRAANLVKAQKEYYESGQTKPVKFRKVQLMRLRSAVEAFKPKLMFALKEDLGKSSFESYATEIGMVLDSIRYTLKNLKQWSSVEKVPTPLAHFPSSSRIYKDPLGVVLILSPWNYPVQLMLTPLVAAIAAGNCAVMKPSRHVPHTAEVLAEMIREYFDQQFITVIRSEHDSIHNELLSQPFDHIFFTGSAEVGRKVMAAAAGQLIPVTLELGGKSPCIVDCTAKVDQAARRIVWGKFINAGQTCVAPDYVLVDKKISGQLVAAMERYVVALYGKEPLESPDLPKIINEKHFNRLKGYLEDQEIFYGGQTDEANRRIAPTILTSVEEDCPLMTEEIFGPILPVMAYEELEDALDFVKSKEHPLALYLFSNNKATRNRILSELSFGGGCINDTIVHLANPNLPFGGVGGSGMGSYHGKKGFETFTHEKSVLKKSTLLDIPLRYPPYRGKLGLLQRVLK